MKILNELYTVRRSFLSVCPKPHIILSFSSSSLITSARLKPLILSLSFLSCHQYWSPILYSFSLLFFFLSFFGSFHSSTPAISSIFHLLILPFHTSVTQNTLSSGSLSGQKCNNFSLPSTRKLLVEFCHMLPKVLDLTAFKQTTDKLCIPNDIQ